MPVIPPVLVKPEAMEGTGFLGQAAKDVYYLPDDDLYLVGTSEVPLAAYHMDEVLDADQLPRRYAGWSSCFRREAGSYGKDTRGIIRVHQFDKVEMFSYVAPEDAAAEHQRLLAWEKEMLAKVEVPYRVIDVAAGDLGVVGRAQVRLRGVGADAGPLPRADVDLELHAVPGPPAAGPACATRTACGRSPRSTARSRRPGGWSRSWRTTSRPTARSSCRRRCARSSAAGRCSNRSPDPRAT